MVLISKLVFFDVDSRVVHHRQRRVEACLLLVHIKVCVGVLQITQVRALLEVTQVVSSVGVRAVGAKAVLTLQTPHREVVWDLAHGQVARTLLAVRTQDQALHFLFCCIVGTVMELMRLAVSFAHFWGSKRLEQVGMV